MHTPSTIPGNEKSPSALGQAPAAAALGWWSAVLCTVLSLVYVAAQLAEWMGVLGSAGGPHSRSTAFGLALLLTPSLLLGIAFVVLMVSVHHQARADKRVWSHVAVAFASMYATLICLVYFVQLTFVMPRLARGEVERIQLLVFEPFDSFLYAVDMLGYSLMSLATLFAAPAFEAQGRERWLRASLIANGCLIPFLALQMYYPWLIYGGALWAITFPAVTGLLAAHFRRLARGIRSSRTEFVNASNTARVGHPPADDRAK